MNAKTSRFEVKICDIEPELMKIINCAGETCYRLSGILRFRGDGMWLEANVGYRPNYYPAVPDEMLKWFSELTPEEREARWRASSEFLRCMGWDMPPRVILGMDGLD